MAESFNVIALISGGKDSLFSILHCLENGHNVVALANLYPKVPRTDTHDGGDNVSTDQQEGEDLNSFMYQTVGHSIIPLYAECLGLPLYRREIAGSAVQTGRYYDSSNLDSSLDETEDLIPLLKRIKHEHPEANALCSGAILSTYQRTRVESIAVRLGLTPLAYLWQYPALPPPAGRTESLTGLLEDMGAAGCDARIIKIASGGIKESLLWSNVADIRTQLSLVNGLRPFFSGREFWLRGAVLGEGGEYETLAVNGPRRLWKKRIEIADDQSSILVGDGGVSYLRLTNVRTVESDQPPSGKDEVLLRVPRMFDPQFEAVLRKLEGQEMVTFDGNQERSAEAIAPNSHGFVSADLVKVDNLTRAHLSVSNITFDSNENIGSATNQMREICTHLTSVLETISSLHNLASRLTTSNIVSSTLLLKDMSDFSPVNSIYSSLFRPGEPNPPARVTIACHLPENMDISLSVVLDLGPRSARRGLHVQSRSYWAPANIGPYSQAICVCLDGSRDPDVKVHDAGLVEMVHIAGQIPLVPQSMQVSTTDFPEQAALSLQHLWRIGQERDVDIWPWGIAFLKQSNDIPLNAELSCQVWQQVHETGTRRTTKDGSDEDEEGPDAWDLQYNRFAQSEISSSQMSVGEHLHVLPNLAVFNAIATESMFAPPFIAAEVVSLPRDAKVEWWSMGVANLPQGPSSTPRVSWSRTEYIWGSVTKVTILPRCGTQDQGQSDDEDRTVHLVTAMIRQASMQRNNATEIELVERDLSDFLTANESIDNSMSSSLEVVHGTVLISLEGRRQWSKMQKQALFANLTVIPCNSLYGSRGVDTIIGGPQVDSSGFSKASTKNGQDISSPPDAAVRPDTVLCQPLAAAVTMRIDSQSTQTRTSLGVVDHARHPSSV